MRRYDPVIDELLEVTDLVMLDLKQMNDEIHQNLVGVSNHRTLEFAKYIANKGVKTDPLRWYRAGQMMMILHIVWANLPGIWVTWRKLNSCPITSWVNTNGWQWVKSTSSMA